MTSLRRAAGLLLFVAVTAEAFSIVEIARMVDLADHGESSLAAFVARWLVEPAGPAWFGLPWTVMPYGPLMPLLWRACATLLPGVSLLLVGRGLALACAALLAGVIWSVVVREGGSAIAALWAIVIFLGSTIGEGWLPRGRVDILAALLTALAYSRIAKRERLVVSAAVWLAVASLAKQTALVHALPLAWISWRWCGRGGVARFVAALTAFTLLVWATVALWSTDFLFTSSTATLLGRQLHFSQYIPYVQSWVASPSGIAILLSALVIASVPSSSALDNVWFCGFLWAFIFGAMTSISEGASVNYMLDATWLGAILTGMTFSRLETQRPAVAYWMATSAMVLGLPVVALRHYPHGALQPPANHRAARVAQITLGKAAVIADGDLVAYVAPGTVPLVNDPFLFRLFDDGHRAPTVDLLRALESRDALVLFSQPLATHERFLRHWPSPVLEALRREFCVESWEEGVLVYRRRTYVTTCLAEQGFDTPEP